MTSKRILTRRSIAFHSSIKSFDSSGKTSEGTHPLEKNALEIGKILRVAVIDKEDATIKRITTSQKGKENLSTNKGRGMKD